VVEQYSKVQPTAIIVFISEESLKIIYGELECTLWSSKSSSEPTSKASAMYE
jgi:hypothetical protein